jgi:deoxyribodipyrimidine photo-lyase
MVKPDVAVFWYRRDLRLHDNAGLYHALKSNLPVLPVFIFDTEILGKLNDTTDKRVLFIHKELTELNNKLREAGSSILVKVGEPLNIWKELLSSYNIKAVYTNHDFEPYAIKRDSLVKSLLSDRDIAFHTFKDHVVFEKNEITKEDGLPYTVFTPYSKKWRTALTPFHYKAYPVAKYIGNLFKTNQFPIPSLSSFGFRESNFTFPEKKIKSDIIQHYSENRDFPAIDGTSRLGIHLRFGTLSIRQLLEYALERNHTYVNELIWRDFYQMILWHFPHVVTKAFRPEYDQIKWENNEAFFTAWCEGKTGYPLVDAGMRELNATGYIHNRVRMVAASFLTKHLLIDWRWGEAYFAEKLLDFDLAANNGGWQWAAGSGTDAAPYFRVFNPTLQAERFDKQQQYVQKWIPELGTGNYPSPIVEHDKARKKVLEVYEQALKPEQSYQH